MDKTVRAAYFKQLVGCEKVVKDITLWATTALRKMDMASSDETEYVEGFRAGQRRVFEDMLDIVRHAALGDLSAKDD
jgi:hypothetical protein